MSESAQVSAQVSAQPRLTELLPHRPPMLLLDELVEHDADSATCTVTVRETSMFVTPEGVPAWVALEYCAQCVAAFAGLRARARGGEPRIGLLVAARDLMLETEYFRPGETLIVRARLEFGEERVGRFECDIRRDGIPVAKASLSVYLPEHGAPLFEPR